MSTIITKFWTEPAVRNGVISALAGLILVLLDVIEGAGGEIAAFLAIVLGQAGITRQEVSPVRKG